MSQGSIAGSYISCKKAQLDAIPFVETCIDTRCKTLDEDNYYDYYDYYDNYDDYDYYYYKK